MRHFALAAVAALALGACAPEQAGDAAPTGGPITPAATEAPAGTYGLDKNHASLIVRIGHFGLSRYTARFTDFDATIAFYPAEPTASTVSATVNPRSLRTEFPADYRATHPGASFASFEDTLALDDRWLSAEAFPELSFRSTAVALTGPNTADLTGDLTMRGQTHPITLHATFNGGFAAHPFNPQGPARIGFSAKGTFSRAAYGMSFLLPGEGVGVSDEVELIIEAEFERQAQGEAGQ